VGAKGLMSDNSVQGGSSGPDPRATRRLLVQTARNGQPWLGLVALAALLMAAADTALPALLGRSVDSTLHRAPPLWIPLSAVGVVALIAADALDDLATGYAVAGSTSWLRRSLLRHFLTLGTRGGRFSSGDLSARLTANAAEAGQVGPSLVRGGANILTGLGAVVALGLIDPWLCLTFLGGLPVLALILRAFARQASVTAERYLEAQGEIAARLVDAVSGARTIAAAGTLDQEIVRVLGPLPELRRHGADLWRQLARFGSLDALLAPMLGVVVLAVAGSELSRGRITPGAMLAAAEYALLGTALTSLTSVVQRVAQARAAARRCTEVLNEQPMEYGDAQLPEGGGCIEFRGVNLRAGGQAVLDVGELLIPGGRLVAVVGQSGSGKSLLARLAGRLIDPEEGEVTLDGVPLRRLRRDVLRGAVTYAFERPSLFGETLAEAISFGPRPSSTEVVASAARTAQADGFIRRMPRAYETRLAEAPMSGGEVQRISLARAFAHAGRVLILDDVAASLDTVTEHEISRVLSEDLGHITRLVVAHRASTAAQADVVVWLEHGRIRAAGLHEVLWHDPDYRALFLGATEPAGAADGGGDG